MADYATQIKNPVSKKIVFATATFLKHWHMWTTNGDTTYYWASDENVTAMRENDVDLGDPKASQAALDAFDTSAKGAWYWDWTNKLIWYKPIDGSTPFETFVLADIQFRWGNFGGEDENSLPFQPVITSLPTLTTRVGQRFDAELGQTGSGSLGMENYEQTMARLDFEPNGRITITERPDTFGGV